MTLSDSALALAEACQINPVAAFEDPSSGSNKRAFGAHQFATQIMVVMSDIASEFGESPEQCAAITLFAVAGMVSDMYAIAADAGLCDVADVPPHPMRAVPQMVVENESMNRAQRRQMDRDMNRNRTGSRLVLPDRSQLRLPGQQDRPPAAG